MCFCMCPQNPGPIGAPYTQVSLYIDNINIKLKQTGLMQSNKSTPRTVLDRKHHICLLSAYTAVSALWGRLTSKSNTSWTALCLQSSNHGTYSQPFNITLFPTVVPSTLHSVKNEDFLITTKWHNRSVAYVLHTYRDTQSQIREFQPKFTLSQKSSIPFTYHWIR